MQSTRFLLALVVVLLSFASFTFAQPGDPLTHCAPVTVDAFSVAASSSGADVEGTMLTQVNGTYPIQVYTATLPNIYISNRIFFRVILLGNNTLNTTGTVGVTFTASLNGALKLTATNTTQVFSPDPNTGITDIEFTNWLVNIQNGINNVFQLNVTEVITIGQDVTQCSYVYTLTVFNPPKGAPTGAFVTGDPQFVGLRGQSFQVHGVDGAVYNLISDKSMQLNSRFSFLEGPRPCPVMPSTGKLSSACWSHPGSYLSELALKTIGGSELLIVSGEAATGFASVTLDGEALPQGASAKLNFGSSGLTGSVSVDNTHEITIHAGHFDITLENNDGFVNLRHVSVPSASWSQLKSHGLLGQTWSNKRYAGKIKYIEGDVDDYLIEDDNMFGDAFLYNRFTQ